jgi:hypothetical protein
MRPLILHGLARGGFKHHAWNVFHGRERPIVSIYAGRPYVVCGALQRCHWLFERAFTARLDGQVGTRQRPEFVGCGKA